MVGAAVPTLTPPTIATGRLMRALRAHDEQHWRSAGRGCLIRARPLPWDCWRLPPDHRQDAPSRLGAGLPTRRRCHAGSRARRSTRLAVRGQDAGVQAVSVLRTAIPTSDAGVEPGPLAELVGAPWPDLVLFVRTRERAGRALDQPAVGRPHQHRSGRPTLGADRRLRSGGDDAPISPAATSQRAARTARLCIGLPPSD